MKRLDLKPLADAVEAATGRRPHLSTALRWANQGRKGVRLKCWELGGRKLTTIQAVHDFMADVASVSNRPGFASPAESMRTACCEQQRVGKLLETATK